MPQFAKTNDVHHHVFVELHAVFQRQLGRHHHCLRVIAVHVQNGRFNHLHHIRAIQGGATVARVAGGKTNLVIDDDVHRTTREIPARFGQRQGFHHHALASKCGVAMHQYRQDLQALGVAASIHARTHGALNHGVDNFQV